MVRLAFQCTNNQAEYEALVQGLLLLKEGNVADVSIQGDSLLIIQQAKVSAATQFCSSIVRWCNGLGVDSDK